MALSGKPETLQKSTGKTRGIAWKDKDVEELLALMKEETIRVSVQNRRSIEVQARTDKTIKNLYLRLFLFFCKAVERKVDFSIFC